MLECKARQLPGDGSALLHTTFERRLDVHPGCSPQHPMIPAAGGQRASLRLTPTCLCQALSSLSSVLSDRGSNLRGECDLSHILTDLENTVETTWYSTLFSCAARFIIK
jgi:hypothetical protein